MTEKVEQSEQSATVSRKNRDYTDLDPKQPTKSEIDAHINQDALSEPVRRKRAISEFVSRRKSAVRGQTQNTGWCDPPGN